MIWNALRRFRLPAVCAAWGALLLAAESKADVTIYGSLSNFDCPNETGDDCDEFEFELEGPHVEDVYHTYTNYNYGPPTVTALPGNIGIRVKYDTPLHVTAPHAIEHFGVSFRNATVTAQRFKWHTIVHVPPPPLAMPIIRTEVIYQPTGAILRETVQNVDTYGRTIWVTRRKTRTNREVALEELMPADPLIQGTTPVDLEPHRLLAGEMLIEEEDGPANELASYVMVYQVLSNTQGWYGGEWGDAPGALLTTLLSATVAAGSACPSQYLPVVTTDPVHAVSELDGRVFFTVEAQGPDAYGEIFWQWRHEGVPMPGEDNPILEVEPVRASDAGAYDCVITNDCGFVISGAARLTVILPCDPCDLNCDGTANTFDIQPMITALSGAPATCSSCAGDANSDGTVNPFDINAFIACLGG